MKLKDLDPRKQFRMWRAKKKWEADVKKHPTLPSEQVEKAARHARQLILNEDMKEAVRFMNSHIKEDGDKTHWWQIKSALDRMAAESKLSKSKNITPTTGQTTRLSRPTRRLK